MRMKLLSPHTYAPDSLASLMLYRKRQPDAVLYAGGTYLLRRTRGRIEELPREIIYLGGVDELKRINRTDRYLEIGAGVPISQILDTLRKYLPAALTDCLESIGNPQVRNLATIGGNICVRDERMDLFPVLALMEVRVEIRKPGSSKWLPLNKCLDGEGNFELNAGEVLTRFRLPYDTWDAGFYRKGSALGESSGDRFSFCGLAKNQRNTVNELRFIFCLGKQLLLRIRDIELALMGKSLPLSGKTIDLALEEAGDYCGNIKSTLPIENLGKIFAMLRLFLQRL